MNFNIFNKCRKLEKENRELREEIIFLRREMEDIVDIHDCIFEGYNLDGSSPLSTTPFGNQKLYLRGWRCYGPKPSGRKHP